MPFCTFLFYPHNIAQKKILGLRPLKGAYGGILNLTIESSENDDLLYHLFNRTRDRGVNFTEGYISIYGQDEYAPLRLIQFKDAFINYISEDFCSTGNRSMILSLGISAGIVQYNKTIKFKKSWAESDFVIEVSRPYQSFPETTHILISSTKEKTNELSKKKDKEPEIIEMEWRDADVMYKIDEIPEFGFMTLWAKVKNVKQGNTITFNLGNEFSSKEYEGVVEGENDNFTVTILIPVENLVIEKKWIRRLKKRLRKQLKEKL